MIFFKDLTLENNVELIRHIASNRDGFPFEVKFKLHILKERTRFFVFQMQLNEKITFDKVSHLIFLFLQYLAQHFALNLGIYQLWECQENGLLLRYYLLVCFSIESFCHNHLVLGFVDCIWLLFIWNWSYKYYCHIFKLFSLLVNGFPWLEWFAKDIVEQNFHDSWGQLLENRDLLEIERDKIFLIWFLVGFLADFGNGHQLLLIILIHELEKILALSQPRRVLFKFLRFEFK